MPKNLLDLSQGLLHVLKLSNTRLMEILKYTYDMNPKEVHKMKKAALQNELTKRFSSNADGAIDSQAVIALSL